MNDQKDKRLTNEAANVFLSRFRFVWQGRKYVGSTYNFGFCQQFGSLELERAETKTSINIATDRNIKVRLLEEIVAIFSLSVQHYQKYGIRERFVSKYHFPNVSSAFQFREFVYLLKQNGIENRRMHQRLSYVHVELGVESNFAILQHYTSATEKYEKSRFFNFLKKNSIT